jgi:hypothetical protein
MRDLLPAFRHNRVSLARYGGARIGPWPSYTRRSMRRHTAFAPVGSVIATAFLWVWCAAAAAQLPASVDELMARVGERIAEYYSRAQGVICLEKSTVQPIGWNNAPEGFSRTVESELRVEPDQADGPAAGAKVIREIRRINGRAPRERDKKDRSGCTDPSPLSPEPLSFLLPPERSEYQFTFAGYGKEKDRAALLIDFVSVNRKSRPELVEDKDGHDDCFDWSGPVATRGRVWVDAATHDVLRVDRRIAGPLDVRVPWNLQRRYGFQSWVAVEREDLTIRYKTVAFREPDEIMLLPESIESLTVVHGGLQSTRRSRIFTDYRRFLTAGRIVKED